MPNDVAVTAIIAARNEADVIRQMAADLAGQGIRIYLIDDGSQDDTVEQARAGAGDALLGVESTGAGVTCEYAWEDLLRRKATLASELPGDWFLHHDADELRESPWRDRGLREGLALVDALGWNAVDFAVFNFPPLSDTFERSQDLRAAFTHWEPGPVHDRVQVKAWKWTGAPVELARSGGHEAEFEGRRVFPLRFVLRHYPIRSQVHGERKVFEERLPRFRAAERARGWHVQYAAFKPGHRFVRDPEHLRAWDGDAVRVELAVRHRGVEELEGRVAEQQAEIGTLERDVSNYTRDLAWHRDEVRRLGEVLERAEAERQSLHEALDVARREVTRLHPELDAARRERDTLHLALDQSLREVPRLHHELDVSRREAGLLHEQLHAARLEVDAARGVLEAGHQRLVQVEVELSEARSHVERLTRQRDAADDQARALHAQLEAIRTSRTWRWTAPLRQASRRS